MTPQERLAELRKAAQQKKEGVAGNESVSERRTVDVSNLVTDDSIVGITSKSAEQLVRTDLAPVASQATPLSAYEQISNRISDLQTSLSQRLPNYENLLRVVHTALMKDEATVHLLTEDQIGIIVSGLCTKKNVVIAEAVRKSGTREGNKKLAQTRVEDL